MRVLRTRVWLVRDIDPATRAKLQPALIELFLHSFTFDDHEAFARRVLFRSPDARMRLLYGEGDQIIGFTVVNINEFELDGQPHAVIHGSSHNHPQLRGGGGHAFRAVLGEVLRFKLRRPGVPLCLIGEASTPAGYARVRQQCPIMHPRLGVPTPAQVTALVVEVTRRRGFFPVDGDPWRVELGLPSGFRDREKTRRHAEGSRNPYFIEYLQLNPDFIDGHWLIVYVPFDRAQMWAMLTAALFDR